MISNHLFITVIQTGTSANEEHFQAYLLEGVHRWNCDRAAAAVLSERPSHTSYATTEEFLINKKNQQLFGKAVNPLLTAPRKYTGK